ncbi:MULTISPECIES: glycosyltransferase family 39 protein [Clostridium]|uniref:Glycosyltransferase family 39 protein n=1 Tax=Clostridium cibarium TaxID=2762247 RepID=A0ABR8PVK1_9CLOT|nr:MULTISPECIES: glycosyltransferase family 39 protein [Clostridium]MBD7912159.1 glycosyltransferase family 39 protein [Clostridium cibarium]
MEKLKNFKLTKEKIMLGLILILSCILNFTNLSIDGYANEYYAAGVKSMTTSLKNFFFVAFDPTGFVTIDKPPLGFMIQAISAKIFGYSGWSIIFPQALAGVISVGVIYYLVKRSFGTAAGLISALALAVTPVFVAVSRNNTCDNLLVLALLLACVALTKAAEKGKLSYLLMSLAIVGIGFNIKMLQAYMVVPAIYLTYLISRTVSVKKRIVHLILSTVVLVVVSFSWAFVVDLVPTSSRPYVGSSTNNTEMELIIGHNGLERLGLSGSSSGGPSGGGGEMQPPGQDGSNSEMMQNQGSNGNMGEIQIPPDQDGDMQTPPDESGENSQMQGGPGGQFRGSQGEDGKGSREGGPGGQGGSGQMGGQDTPASLTRLFSNNSLSDQIIWLFPIAFIGFIAAAIQEKLKFPIDNRRKQALVLWFAWLLPEFIYFSFTTGLFHPYYLTMLSAPIAALFGIGTVSMWNLYKEGGWKSWFLPGALAVNGGVQVLLLSYYYSTVSIAKILMIAVAALGFISSIGLTILNLMKKDTMKFKKILITTALIGLFISPAVCSATAIFKEMAGSFPSAGLSLMSNKGQKGQMGGASHESSGSTSKLIEFLQKNKTNEKYILVTSSTNGSASEIIIKTDESVMALGGFFGTDKVITLDEFKELAKNGEIRYVMTGGQGGNSSDIMNWVQEVGTKVDSSEWSDSNKVSNELKAEDESSQNNHRFGGMEGSLYDLKSFTDSQN